MSSTSDRSTDVSDRVYTVVLGCVHSQTDDSSNGPEGTTRAAIYHALNDHGPFELDAIEAAIQAAVDNGDLRSWDGPWHERFAVADEEVGSGGDQRTEHQEKPTSESVEGRQQRLVESIDEAN